MTAGLLTKGRRRSPGSSESLPVNPNWSTRNSYPNTAQAKRWSFRARYHDE